MRCRVGDIAVVTASDFEQNVGCLVEVTGPALVEGDWRVRSLGRLFVGINCVGFTVRHHEADALDSQLRPLRDGGESEIRELAAHELEAVSITGEHGAALWPIT